MGDFLEKKKRRPVGLIKARNWARLWTRGAGRDWTVFQGSLFVGLFQPVREFERFDGGSAGRRGGGGGRGR